MIFLNACAQQKIAEKKVESAISDQVSPVKQDDIIEAARAYINKSPNLTDVQKKNLLTIEEKAIIETGALREEINKVRLVLVKSALEPSYDARVVEILKNKILKLERKKIRVGLNAFTEARNVIDPRQIRESKALNKVFINEHLPPF
jgi:PBP1b-binding outer membrane lipoprotein LpoB